MRDRYREKQHCRQHNTDCQTSPQIAVVLFAPQVEKKVTSVCVSHFGTLRRKSGISSGCCWPGHNPVNGFLISAGGNGSHGMRGFVFSQGNVMKNLFLWLRNELRWRNFTAPRTMIVVP
jgi:hypothetical protein